MRIIADIPPTIYRKLVIIGDGACGKTSLLSVFTLGYFPTVGSPRSSMSLCDPVANMLFLAICEICPKQTLAEFEY